MWNINNGMFWGMNFIWWIVWIILLIWIFATPWSIPGARRKNSAMDILNERFAKGEIDKTEYEEKKNLIKQNQ